MGMKLKYANPVLQIMDRMRYLCGAPIKHAQEYIVNLDVNSMYPSNVVTFKSPPAIDSVVTINVDMEVEGL